MAIFRATAIAVLSSLLASQGWSADENTPASLPETRYAAMREKSPFALATPVETTPAPQASFAANWFVGGMGRYGDADFVTIKSRDLSVQFTLFGNELNKEHGVSVASVSWSSEIGQSTVILQKGTETAKLEFNQALLRATQPIAGAPQAPTAGPSTTGSNAGTLAPNRINPGAAASVTAKGGSPIVIPAQAGRQFPATSRAPGIVQRRVQIIAQPK